MPGPGSHLLYTLGTGLGLMHLTDGGRFTAHHALVYALNSLVGPDIGPVFEWLAKQAAPGLASAAMATIHDPLGYILVLGAPLSLLYSWLSFRLPARASPGWPRPGAEEPAGLTPRQCALLLAAGSLSHFFLDTLFEENGRTPLYRWVLSTGYWSGPAPLYADTVAAVGALIGSLLVGFYYLNCLQAKVPEGRRQSRTLALLLAVALLYCALCAANLYLLPGGGRPAVGEEADLGVLVFLAAFFFLPHGLCLASFHGRPREAGEKAAEQQLPLTRFD